VVDWILLTSTLVYASVLSLLSLGITLIYMTTKVFNFAHARLALVGAYGAAIAMALYITAAGLEPDFQWRELGPIQYRAPYPASVLLVGMLGALAGGVASTLVEYYAILKPLSQRGADSLKLMIATLAYDFILMAALMLLNTHKAVIGLLQEISLISTSMDFSSFDVTLKIGDTMIKGDSILAPTILFILTVAIFILLFKTTLGIKMRASIENPPLAEVIGINVNRIYAISWIIAGATAGLAGLFILLQPSAGGLKPVSASSPADEIVVSAFAGSIVGGVNSVFGSLGGGFLIGFVEIYVTKFISAVTGYTAITKYSKVISMLAVGVTLLFAPQGLAGLYKEKLAGKSIRELLRFPGKARVKGVK